LSIHIEKNGDELLLRLNLFYYYADIEPLGPVIDGDIVVQGSMVDDRFLPSLCTLEIENEADEKNFKEVLAVPPLKMMINTGADGEDPEDVRKFIIPVSVPPEYVDKNFRICIYIMERHLVSTDDENADYLSMEKRKEMTLAVESIPNAPNSISVKALEDLLDLSVADIKNDDNETGNENGNTPLADADEEKEIEEMEERLLKSGQILEDDDAYGEGSLSDNAGQGENSKLVLHEVHIASDYDDLVAFQSEGYQLICTHVTPTGPIQDQEQLWKFHVVGKYGDPTQPGVEDIVFVKCLKSMGQLPSLPFYHILHDYDLSDPEDGYAVYLAVKTGPNPRFRKLVMLSSNLEDEDHLKQYIESVPGIYRSAPEELERLFGGRCGLMFLTSRSKKVSHTGGDSLVAAEEVGEVSLEKGDAKNVNVPDADDDDEEPEEFDDDMEDDEEIIDRLRGQIERMEGEKMQWATMNNDLQKRAVLLIQREKAMQGQATGTGKSNSEAANSAGGNNTGGGDNELTYEQSIEKEKQYHDVLRVIVEARNKLEKQLRDFEQLAVDLQTRLDDKEFNAKSISSSFKQFKREILSKAENSRTGHHIPKPQIEAIEGSETKREEELEKVRLRNIGLRNLQKKLENTLRAREKLADDLHYIDFEQLKIENQTLNEKIEERNEELAKLKRKKTTTVQVLTHVREKLRFTENTNTVLREKVASIDRVISRSRNIVTQYKLDRDGIRLENMELRAKQGFATSDLLLTDYEGQKQRTEILMAEIMELKNRYEILSRQVKLGNSTSLSGTSNHNPLENMQSSASAKIGNWGSR
jgi:hypothetical protein